MFGIPEKKANGYAVLKFKQKIQYLHWIVLVIKQLKFNSQFISY